MIDQQYAKESKSVLLNILGHLRWATPAENGGWNVASTVHNGKYSYYQEYHTNSGIVVWSVNEKGRYPNKEELTLLLEEMNKN